jgi:hypothetical protein
MAVDARVDPLITNAETLVSRHFPVLVDTSQSGQDQIEGLRVALHETT